MTKQNIPKVCSAPWVSLAINVDKSFSLCCNTILNVTLDNWNDTSIEEVLNSKKMQSYRNDFSKGKYGPECFSCTKFESADSESRRDEYISKFSIDLDKTNFELKDIKHLDLFLSNKCNLSCRTCGSYLSTGWNKDNKKLNEKTYNFFPPNKEQMSELLEISKNLKSIYIAGGEPLICDETYLILETLAKYNNECEIVINTNLSKLEYNEFNIIDLSKDLPNLSLNISIDGVAKKGEYIRNGLNFSNFNQNLELLSKTNITNTFIITISILNIFDIEEILEYILSKNIEQKYYFEFNYVSSPSHYNIQILPKKIKSILQADLYSLLIKNKDSTFLSRYSNKVISLCKYLQIDNNDSDLNSFFTQTQKIDSVRNQNFKEIFSNANEILFKMIQK